MFLRLFASWDTLFLRLSHLGHSVSCSVSSSPWPCLSLSLCPGRTWPPSYTCPHLPRRQGNFVLSPPSRRPRWAPASPRCSRRACVGSAAWPGPPCRRELSLPGPRLRAGWVRRGIRSGEHWLHKGCERPEPGGPSFARAGGRDCVTAEVTEVGHARLGNHPGSLGRGGGERSRPAAL